MIDIEELEFEFNAFYGDKENEHTLLARMFPLIAEVKRLREELEKAEQKIDKYCGALNMALEHLGYQGADHEQFCKENYECNVYGDDLKEMIE